MACVLCQFLGCRARLSSWAVSCPDGMVVRWYSSGYGSNVRMQSQPGGQGQVAMAGAGRRGDIGLEGCAVEALLALWPHDEGGELGKANG